MKAQRKSPGFSFQGLRLTAMIDVIFLLLTFFLLTARFQRPEQTLPFQLPAVRTEMVSASIIEPMSVSISYLDNNTCQIDIAGIEQIPLNQTSLEKDFISFLETLKSIMQQQHRITSDPIELSCDDQISWDFFVKIYNLLYTLDITNITIVISEEP